MNAKRISTRTSKNSDVEIPPLTPAQLKRMRPLREVHPKLYAKLQAENAGKQRITIRLDLEVLDWFKGQVNRAGGGNYQTLINEALKSHIRARELREIIREVLREELRASDKRAA